MITAGIFINGGLFMARSAVNQQEKNDKGEVKYLTDANEVIWHKPEDGAKALAIKLLESIKEQA